MRKLTRAVKIGGVTIGAANPIAIQSMTNTPTADYHATLAQINRLLVAGCHIVRVAVPDEQSLSSFSQLVRGINAPLVADIHFDYRLALGAISCGAAEVRINPGNIGGDAKAREVLKAAARSATAVRIGVNSGSLPKQMLAKHGGPTALAMVETAVLYSQQLADEGCENAVFSLKSSDVLKTIEANIMFSEQSDFPLHIGVTEAGTLLHGAVRSAVGIGVLLAKGIGDTIRVSLTADPVEEVRVAQDILDSLNLGPARLRIVSCPTCARTSPELIDMAMQVERALVHYAHLPLKVAVMGCSVNGPGEAREADVGVALAPQGALLFRNGEAVELITREAVVSRLIEEVSTLALAEKFRREEQS